MTRAPVALLAVATSLLTGCAHLRPSGTQRPPDTRRLRALTRETGCFERDGLPDQRCTPGAVRVGISLSVICRYGYTRSIRPPESYTESLKLRQMRAYGLLGPARGYEEDHLVPLSIGERRATPRISGPSPAAAPTTPSRRIDWRRG
jgi:hypothetical protein